MAIFDPTGARATVPTGPTGISIPTRAPHLASPITPARSVIRPAAAFTGARRFTRGGTRF